jgi:hypothetical protein
MKEIIYFQTLLHKRIIILRSILLLSSHLCMGLPGGLFLSGFPTKTVYTLLLSPIRATCPIHLILLDLITLLILGEHEPYMSPRFKTSVVVSNTARVEKRAVRCTLENAVQTTAFEVSET